MTIKFGIIGCGYIAERHLKHIVDHRAAEVSAVFDIDYTKAQALGGKYKVVTEQSYEDLLKREDIDIVTVCTPNGLHAIHTIQALNAGKDVLVEKPMATNVVDAKKMVDAAKTNNKRLFVVKQNRYNPPVQAVKELLDNNKLGDVYAVHLNCFWNRNDQYYSNSSWKGTLELDGGVLYTQFSHFIDILFYLFGEIEGAKGAINNFNHKELVEYEDTGSFIFKLKNGALGSLNYTTCAFEQNMEGSITVIAEKATIKIGGKYLNTIDYQKTDGFDVKHLPASSPANNYGYYQGSMSNHDYVIDNVVETFNGRAEIMTNAYEGLKVVEIIEQLYQAAK